MPVLPERSIEYTKIYCRLVVILITKTRATGDGVWTIFDYMPKYSSYIPNTTPVSSQYPVLSSKQDIFMPVLPERSKEDTKIYCRLVVILITKARATGDGVSTIFHDMPKHCSYIQNTPVYPVLPSKQDPFIPLLPERSKEDTKIYCRLVVILITKGRATGEGV